MKKQIRIFDTTLRDGEQVPGAKLNKRQKLEIAKQLERLNVDVIEAGFPCSSPGDLEAVKAVAQEVKNCIICGLARAVKSDIDLCWEALKEAAHPRIHVFLGSSDIHVQKKLKKDKESAFNMAIESVRYARSLCHEVEYSTEDASRSDFDYLCQVIRGVIREGASIINIPDTVGYAIPDEFGDLIKKIKEAVPELDNVTLSVHCHNDLGLAVANSLAAIREGAEQVECTVNGIGERAGNASMEEIVMAIKTRSAKFNVDTRINTKEIYRTSRLVSRVMNIPVQPNKAIVGSNAFAHSSGIHQDGILKDRATYEIIRPEDVGIKQHSIILTARSGRAALRHRLEELGFTLDKDIFERVYHRFLNVADRKKEILSEDLISIVEVEMTKVPETYSFVNLQILSGNDITPMASVTLKKENRDLTDASIGNGPVNAAFNSVERIIGKSGKLLDFDLKAVTHGKDALGEAMVRVKINEHVYSGTGTSPDIIEASVRAYINAFNRYFANNK